MEKVEAVRRLTGFYDLPVSFFIKKTGDFSPLVKGNTIIVRLPTVAEGNSSYSCLIMFSSGRFCMTFIGCVLRQITNPDRFVAKGWNLRNENRDTRNCCLLRQDICFQQYVILAIHRKVSAGGSFFAESKFDHGITRPTQTIKNNVRCALA
ncbi:hypothetical protein D3C75_535210 [compost metagenome]